MLWLLFIQATVAGKQVAPQSWGAYAALVFSSITCGLLVYDRITGKGKSIQTIDDKIERLCEQVQDFEETQKVMDGHLSSLSKNVGSLTQEWQGVDGKNGWKSVIRQMQRELTEVVRWKERKDAIAEYEKEQLRRTGRSPERVRDRLEDIE